MYWLMKSEPGAYSFKQLATDGKTLWDGVRNYQARNNMMKMKVGDLAFFYHSVVGKEVVGVMEVTREHFPDPTDESKKFVVVEVKHVKPLIKAVTLETIKHTDALSDMPLIKQHRLSVMPLSKAQWDKILALGQTTL
jgi:predicted RNA-binding protein with PUA-like domain